MRVTTEDTTGRFDVNMSDGMVLEPNASVALQSANFTRETASVSLNAETDTFRMTTDSSDADNLRQLQITDQFGHGTTFYDNRNFVQLLENFSHSINVAMDIQLAADVGVQAVIETNKDSRVEIKIKRTHLLNWNADAAANIMDHAVFFKNVTRGVTLQKTTSNANPKFADGRLGNAIAADKSAFGRGAALARVRCFSIQDATDATKNGFFMGLIEESKRPLIFGDTSALSTTDFLCGIQVGNSDTTIQIQTSNEFGQAEAGLVDNNQSYTPNLMTGGAEGDHDVFTIENHGGVAKMFQYTATAPAGRQLNNNFFNLKQNVLDPTTNYYFVVCLLGPSGTTKVDQCGAINDPFFTRPSTVASFTAPIPVGNLLTNFVFPNPPAPTFETVMKITLQRQNPLTSELEDNKQLMEFLGFTNSDLNPDNIKSGSYDFVAENASRASISSETFLIQLLGLPLESYDSVGGGRESTLYTIVHDVEQKLFQEINFNSSYPIYIQIKNRNKIQLRNFKCRILDSDLQPLTLQGRSQLTLLFN